jgi:hypothetical protein
MALPQEHVRRHVLLFILSGVDKQHPIRCL